MSPHSPRGLQAALPFEFDPLSFGDDHYVVVLPSHGPELHALDKLQPIERARITPLLTVREPVRRPGLLKADRIRRWIRRMYDVIGTSPFFVDVDDLNPNSVVMTEAERMYPLLDYLLDGTRRRGMTAVPVAHVRPGSAARNSMASTAAIVDGRGIALRYDVRAVNQRQMNASSQLHKSLEETGAEVGRSDLLLDLGLLRHEQRGLHASADELAEVVTAAREVGQWRNIVVLGTSIPATLDTMRNGTVAELDRLEWQCWLELQRALGSGSPSFGDYAVRPGVRGTRLPHADLRYTADTATVITRGYPDDHDRRQFVAMCRRLTCRPDFKGREYSWGDEAIADCAIGRRPPGDQTFWRTAAAAHHFAAVADQLSSR